MLYYTNTLTFCNCSVRTQEASYQTRAFMSGSSALLSQDTNRVKWKKEKRKRKRDEHRDSGEQLEGIREDYSFLPQHLISQ